MIISKLDKASFANEQEREQIIRELVKGPDKKTVEMMIHVLSVAPKSRWKVAVEVIRAIGYPRNSLAIPQLLDQLSDRNSPVWNEVVQTFAAMGPQVVVPYFILTMLNRRSQNYWIDAIAGMCTMLTIVERDFALACGPVVTYLLSQGKLSDEFEKLDLVYPLDVLQIIGPDCAKYALPTLIDFVRKEGASELGKQASNLISSFDQDSLEPYKLLLASSEIGV